MNAHAKILPANRTDETVANIRQCVTDWYAADNARHEPRRRLAVNRMDGLMHELSWLPCRSPGAAIAKLYSMESDIGCALSHLDEVKFMGIEQLLERHVGSVIRWIEAEFGIRREDVLGGDYFGSDRTERRAWGLDPDGAGEIPR